MFGVGINIELRLRQGREVALGVGRGAATGVPDDGVGTPASC